MLLTDALKPWGDPRLPRLVALYLYGDDEHALDEFPDIKQRVDNAQRQVRNLTNALRELSVALTGKEPERNMIHANMKNLLEGDECYLPDGGYSRIVVRRNARLTDNSRQQVKDAWAKHPELVAALERAVVDIRGEWE